MWPIYIYILICESQWNQCQQQADGEYNKSCKVLCVTSGELYMSAVQFTVSINVYLSSLRSLSSNSWILFSSRVIPAEGRLCPSMSATRDLSSFTWAGESYGEVTVCWCVTEFVHLDSWTVAYLSLQRTLVHLQVVSCRALLHQLWTKLVHLRGDRGGCVSERVSCFTHYTQNASCSFACIFKSFYVAPDLCYEWYGHLEALHCSSPRPARSPVP